MLYTQKKKMPPTHREKVKVDGENPALIMLRFLFFVLALDNLFVKSR